MINQSEYGTYPLEDVTGKFIMLMITLLVASTWRVRWQQQAVLTPPSNSGLADDPDKKNKNRFCNVDNQILYETKICF